MGSMTPLYNADTGDRIELEQDPKYGLGTRCHDTARLLNLSAHQPHDWIGPRRRRFRVDEVAFNEADGYYAIKFKAA